MNVQGENANSKISDTRATGGTCELIGKDTNGAPATIEAHERKRRKVVIAKSDEKSKPLLLISQSCIALHREQTFEPSRLSDKFPILRYRK